MNNHPHDSQISAWFDDELSSAECAEVERRLQQSSEARDELAAVEAVSNWMSELPPAALPRDFASQVVASVTDNVAMTEPTREPVLLAAEPINSTSPLRWTQGLGVLISVAAVLVVAVTLFNGPSPTDDSFESTSFESTVASANTDARQLKSTVQMDGLGGLQAEASGGASYQAKANRSYADRAEKQIPLAMSLPRNALPGEIKVDADLNQVMVGQDVDARVHSGGKVAVVRLTVVDRVEGLNTLQYLLAGKRAATEEAELRDGQSADASAAAKPGEENPNQDDYLVAVYVEASEQQLSAVFEKIRNDAQFQSLRVDRPITAEQLARVTNEQMQKSMRGVGPKPNAAFQAAAARPTGSKPESNTGRKPDPRLQSANEPEKRKLVKKSGDSKKNGPGESPPAADERRLQDELARVSRQLKINLPREMLMSKSQPAAPLSDTPADDVADKRDESRSRKPEAEGAKLAQSRVSRRPLQVIFVLDVVPKRGEQ